MSPCKLGYGRAWEKRRRSFLRDHPMCMHPGCNQPANEVDHVLAKVKGGGDEDANLCAYCKPHHSAKTYREDGALRRKPHGFAQK